MKIRKSIVKQVIAAAAIASLAFPASAFAADNNLTAEYKNGRYSLNMELDTFFNIKNLEFGDTYSRTLEFRNDGYKAITVSMVDVKNNLDDTRLYDGSLLTIIIDGETVYDGPMEDARWSKRVSGRGSFTAEYIYSVPEPEHKPDNSWMHRDMHATFFFVGEWHNSSHGGGGSGTIKPSYNPTNPTAPTDESKPAEETKPTEEGKKKPEKGKIIVHLPKTGDDSHDGILIALFIGSGVGIAVLAYTDRKRKQSDKVDKK